MRKRKNRLSLYLAVQPHEHGRLPNYDLYGSQHRNLDSASLTPSITLIQERNCRTILSLLKAFESVDRLKTCYNKASKRSPALRLTAGD